MEDTRFIPGIIKLFIVLIIAGAIAGTIEWLFENPVILIPVLVLIGGIVYFWIRGIPIEAGRFEREPQLSPAEYGDFIESNRRVVSNGYATTKAEFVGGRGRSTTTSKASPVDLPYPKDVGTDPSSEW